MQVVCARCSARNRIPDDRLHDNPVCGKCGEELMQLRPVELNDQNFQRYAEGTDLPVLVDFWAEWCGPCRAVGPILEEISDEYGSKIKIVKLNTDEESAIAIKYGITSIPSMYVFVNGEVVTQIVGAKPKPALLKDLESFLA